MSAVTVITATVGDRPHLLREAMDSVAGQTYAPADHLVGVDFQRRGGHRVRNLLASAVTTEWLAILDDDDVMYDNHLEVLMAQAANADVVYSWCHVEGDDNFNLYNRPYDPDLLRRSSIVSHNALIRTDLVLDLGGWPEERGYDWKLWVRALDAGARFVCVPEPTWLYRLTPDWAHESRP